MSSWRFFSLVFLSRHGEFEKDAHRQSCSVFFESMVLKSASLKDIFKTLDEGQLSQHLSSHVILLKMFCSKNLHYTASASKERIIASIYLTPFTHSFCKHRNLCIFQSPLEVFALGLQTEPHLHPDEGWDLLCSNVGPHLSGNLQTTTKKKKKRQ